MSTPTAVRGASDTVGYSRSLSAPKRADTNITDKDVSGLSTDEQILHELRQLNRLYRLQAELVTDEPLKTQALWNFLLQAFGLVAGTLFGVFAILAWKAATQANTMATNANHLATNANQFALVGYCQSQTGNDVCSSIQSAASANVAAYASSLYGIVPHASVSTTTSTTSPTTTTTAPTSTGSGPPSDSAANTSTQSSSSSGLATATSTRTPTASPSPAGGSSSSSKGSSYHTGVIVGGVIGGLFGLLLLGCLPWLTFRTKRRKYDEFAPMLVQQQHYDR